MTTWSLFKIQRLGCGCL